MRPRQRHRLLRLAVALLLAAPLAPDDAVAQQLLSSPVLTLDQDRIFSETLFGKRVQAELDQASSELADRNLRLSDELAAEERDLTEKRKTLTPEEFRALADAFDDKVVRLREEQDSLILALQRRRDQERRAFSGRILPILSEIVRESGAVAILDDRAVILSAESIDVTQRAISRIDALLGDGATTAPGETPAPSAGQEPAPVAPGATDTPAPEEGAPAETAPQ